MTENKLKIIDEYLRLPTTLGSLMLAMGVDAKDNQSKNRAKDYIASVLREIEKSASLGDEYKDLSSCTPDSIVQCMIDASKFGIKIDGRQHAHLIKYKGRATLQIGYRGFIAKIQEHYPSADINAIPVYKDDIFTISGKDGYDEYTHIRTNPFASESDLMGVAGVLYYKKEGKEFQRVITMNIDEIKKIRQSAKTTTIWDKWFIEKAKVAVVKRLCKMTFAEISDLQELIAYDNTNNFDVEGDKAKPDIDNQVQLDEFTKKALIDNGQSLPIDSVIENETKKENDDIPKCLTCMDKKFIVVNEGQEDETKMPCPDCGVKHG